MPRIINIKLYLTTLILIGILTISLKNVMYANIRTTAHLEYNELFSPDVEQNTPFKIIIDPGHGGHDPGCKGNHSIEKEITLDISLLVGEQLSTYKNIEVIYTRTKDEFIPLHKRIDIANKSKANLFISIHCNASSNKSAKGSESFVMGLHRSEQNLEVAKRENQVIALEKDYKHNYGDYDPHSPVGHIILSMFQNIHLDQSIQVAQQIESNLSSTASTKSRGVKQAGFVVLRNATMPSILIEAGFLTNASNEKKLLSLTGQKQTATAISKAILEYVNDKQNSKVPTSSLPIAKNKKAEPKVISKVKDVLPIYRIQLAALKEKKINLKQGKWDTIDPIIIQEKGLYKYYVGSYKYKTNADKEKLRLRSLGFKGAFVVKKK